MTPAGAPVDLNPFSPESVQDPYPAHRALRQLGVAHLDALDTWTTARYADVDTVLRDTVHFTARFAAGGGGRMADQELAAVYSGGWPMARTLMTADPPEHKAYRAVLARRFTPRSVLGLEATVRSVVRALIDDFAGQGETDIVGALALPTPLIVFCSLMGIPDDELPLITRFTNDLNDSFTFEIAGPGKARELEIAASVVEFQHYVWDKIAERRRRPGDDLLSLMITSPMSHLDGRCMTDLEILSTMILLLNAGTETTMNLIGNAVEVLLRHPAAYAVLRSDPTLLRGAVDEVLRFESPVQCLFRTALTDVEVGGTMIPSGGRVAVLYGAANRDPARWAAADTFDLHRADAASAMYFGTGEHFCLGAQLARLEGRVALGELVARLPRLELVDGADDRRRRLNPLSRGFERLRVRWDVPGSGPGA